MSSALKLGGKKTVKTLKVNIGEEEYSIPLAGSLSIAELKALRSGTDDGFSFFEKYIPADVINTLTLDEFKQLNDAWKQASEDTSGVDLGE
jgi:hypothetical protein